MCFLNAIMYPHQGDFTDTVSEHIDFLDNEALWREAEHMDGLGMRIWKEGREEGREIGIKALILDNVEERIITKLQKRFDLTEERSRQYYEQFALQA
jgi:hypothetical protein